MRGWVIGLRGECQSLASGAFTVGLSQQFLQKARGTPMRTTPNCQLRMPPDTRRFANSYASYRQLLNSWRLFHARAKFDVARGKNSRNRNGTMTINDVQRQVYVRCTYCDRNISHGATHSSAAKPAGSKPNMNPREKAPTSNIPVGANAPTKATVCPQCKKSLPRCAVCLLNLGTKYYKKSLEGAQGKSLEGGKTTEPENDYDRWWGARFSPNHVSLGV